ncbi:hypothetical protein FOZ61_000449 [Perkinsus olseni]|uniref:TFIIE beta domain-containing protein n=2 Tax=Perkinsus olseni TaxID=32597 RepID=A0A7J6TUZ3_PEROL|nr:hypothetical protein FOZ61_000449 [Perkinsus olseni]KAF4672774.1 hypothetical protein FOL46_008417 [Perkinsus olseni]KAF4694602.1 hypothetical protein FOZ60_007572 [Perkinsus olseni]KAF4748925.1 hypothetical protein FOZ62_008067 [Perkinsus olseni]
MYQFGAKGQRPVESIVKVVLDMLKQHPNQEFTDSQIERTTRERIIGQPAVVGMLQNNPKIDYDPTTRRYKFRPHYDLRDKQQLLQLLHSRPTLMVDPNLLESYPGIDEDISSLLREHACRGVRHPDYVKQIKCERAQAAAEQAASAGDGAARKAASGGPRPKKQQCDLYSNEERCPACRSNLGVILGRLYSDEITSMAKALDSDIKEMWFNTTWPSMADIQKATNEGRNQQAEVLHRPVRKTRGGRQRGTRNKRSSSRPEKVSNTHLAGILNPSPQSIATPSSPSTPSP